MQDPSDIDPSKLVEVLTTTDANLLPVLKSVLESASIPFFVQGDEAHSLFPMAGGSTTLHRTGLGARLMVPQDRAEEARALLAATNTETPADPDPGA